MLAIIFTVLLPVLPILLWKLWHRGQKLGKGEIIVRYVVYGLIIVFFASVMLAVMSDEDTSFWQKIDMSAGFALKYILMTTAIAFGVAAVEWIRQKRLLKIKIDWQRWQKVKWVAFVRKYICPVMLYVLAALVVALNVSLMFDNVLWGDEAFSANTAEKTMYGILQVMYFWDNHPPLHYYWVKLFGELFGFTVPVMHLASLVPFFVGILLAVTAFRKRFGKIPAAFFVMISGLGPACLEYNLEIRMYSLAFMGVAGTFYCAYRVISRGKKLSWIGMVLWALVAAYSHYYALAAAGILLFFTGAAYWLKYRGKTWIKGFFAVLAFIVGYIPWMGFLFTATSNVSNNWWMTDLMSLDRSLNMVLGNMGMNRVMMPLWAVLLITLLLAESDMIHVKRQGAEAPEPEAEKLLSEQKRMEYVTVEIGVPGVKKWSDETYMMAVGAATIVATIIFAYLLCFVMGPVLAERYLYPLSVVTILMLMVGVSRGLALLKELGSRVGISCLEGLGKVILVFLLAILLLIGLSNYKEYRAESRQQDEATTLTLDTIGDIKEDIPLVTNGVKHLGWTVLYHYYPQNEIINGDYRSTEAKEFWYFNPGVLGEQNVKELQDRGYIVTHYGQMQIAVYPFELYHMEKKSTK